MSYHSSDRAILDRKVLFVAVKIFGAREFLFITDSLYSLYSKKLVVALAIAQTHHHNLVLTLIYQKAPEILSKIGFLIPGLVRDLGLVYQNRDWLVALVWSYYSPTVLVPDALGLVL